MHDEKLNGPPAEPEPPSNIVHLKKRKSPDDYWDGYRDGLKAARDGIDRSLAHFDDMLISKLRDDRGGNN